MEWIKTEDKPLIVFDEADEYWMVTPEGDKEFIAVVKYSDKTRPDEQNWWIRHCVIEDEIRLCVVGDDCNEPAGWETTDITHWMPLPEPPK